MEIEAQIEEMGVEIKVLITKLKKRNKKQTT